MMSLQCTVPEKLKFASREINTEMRSHRVGQQHLWPHTREEQRIRQMDLFQHIMRVRFNFKIWEKGGGQRRKHAMKKKSMECTDGLIPECVTTVLAGNE